MEDLSLHILDVVQNSILAGATRIRITFTVDEENSLLTLVIEDNGRGMSSDEMERPGIRFSQQKRGNELEWDSRYCLRPRSRPEEIFS